MHASPGIRLALLFLLAAPPAAAQVAPGDLLVADLGATPGIYVVDPNGKLVTALLQTSVEYPNALAIGGGSPSSSAGPGLLAAVVGSPDRLVSLTPAGKLTTLAVMPGTRPNGVALDTDGTWLVSAEGVKGLLRFDPRTMTITTVWKNSFTARINSVAVNQDNGRLGVALFGSAGPRVLELDASGANVTTLNTTVRDISSIAWDPTRGTYTLTDFVNLDPAEFVRLDPSTGKVSSIVSPSALHFLNAQTRSRSGTWWVVGGRLLGGNGLHEVAANGVFVRSHPLPWPNAAASAVVIHGGRPLSTSGRAAPGQTLSFHLTSARPSDRGKPFFLAVSVASRPPIPLPDGRQIDLRIDPLVVESLFGVLSLYLFGGTNRGRLDAGGNGTVRLALPPSFPASTGIRLFAAYAVVDLAAPWGLGTISNTVGFTLQ